MEKYLKKYEKDYMKMAILKHEETFRKQVSELHRLYRLQMLLMREIDNSYLTRQVKSRHFENENDTVSQQSRRLLDLELPADKYVEQNDQDGMVEDEVEVELTLAVGRSKRRIEGASLTSGSTASFSSSTTSESGCGNTKERNQSLPVSYRAETNVLRAEDAAREARLEQPSWHIQCLRLNIT